MKKYFSLLFYGLLFSSFSYGQSIYKYSIPENLRDQWETDNLLSQTKDSILIYKLFNKLLNEKHQIHSILLVKDGKLVLEDYFGGNTIKTKHDLRSATKSIISILMGIAIDRNFISSIEDPISKYLKNPVAKKNLDPRKEQITIRDLLTMSSGLDCNDWDQNSKGQEDKVYKKNDWLQYTLDLPMVNKPGELSYYCSMGVVLTAEIIRQASGKTIDEFAKQYLFNPLDITNVSWSHTSKKEVIPSGKRLYMTSRDMAKIGKLILDKGKWNSMQIVSEDWIEESTTPQIKLAGMDYGFLWWNIPFKIGHQNIMVKVATGNGGQYIMILSELNTIAVFTGGAYNSQDDKLPFAIMNDIFLPSFVRK